MGEKVMDKPTKTVEIYDLTSPAATWVSATDFPEYIIGSRGATLDNIFYVTGQSQSYQIF